MFDFWVIIKRAGDVQNAFCVGRYLPNVLNTFILWLKLYYLESNMFDLSKILHSAVTNSLTFENQVHCLPGKEWF